MIATSEKPSARAAWRAGISIAKPRPPGAEHQAGPTAGQGPPPGHEARSGFGHGDHHLKAAVEQGLGQRFHMVAQ
jgi:hypothetical protein